MTVTKWVLTNPADATSHTFALNPDGKGGLGEPPYEVLLDSAVMSDGKPTLGERPQPARASSFDVTVMTEAEFRALRSWYDKSAVLTLTDDLGRSSTIFITDFTAKRTRSASLPWLHAITCKYLVLALTDI